MANWQSFDKRSPASTITVFVPLSVSDALFRNLIFDFNCFVTTTRPRMPLSVIKRLVPPPISVTGISSCQAVLIKFFSSILFSGKARRSANPPILKEV